MTPQGTSTTHQLPASYDTTSVGVVDPGAKPVLSIAAGDEVVLSTWGHWGNMVTPETTMADFPAIKENFPKALGPHTVTGPIHIEKAQPGDTLVVEIGKLVPGAHGFNLVVAQPRGRGVLAQRFPDEHIHHFALDRETMTTTLAGRTLGLAPFLGIMGVAPEDLTPRSTVEPGVFGGNIDLALLVEGTQLMLPVFQPGANFFAGDAHAVQGDGEVNQTAIETSMESAHLRFDLKAGQQLNTPRALTPEFMVSLGFGNTLEEAANQAVDDMVNWLTDFGMTPHEAYSMCSLTGNVRVTQMVNGVVGTHVVVPRHLFSSDS